MTDDRQDRIAKIEAQADDLELAVENCRKMILLGRALLPAGLALLAVAAWRGEGAMFVAGVAAGLGGLVLAGSTRATRAELRDRLTALDEERAALIDSLPLTSASQASSLGQGPDEAGGRATS